MDFIERIFGFAPDSGSGSLEFLLVLIPIAGVAYLVSKRRKPIDGKRDALSATRAKTDDLS